MSLETQIGDLFAMAVDSGEVTAETGPDDLDELFLNMVEMYLGDLSLEDLATARRFFDEAVAKLRA